MITEKKLGRYQIRAKIGVSKLSEVYLVYDDLLERRFVLKTLYIADVDHLSDLKQEIKKIFLLKHPNIVSVYDLFETDGYLCMVTEYVEGETLRERLNKGRLADFEAVEVAEQISDTLIYIHERGIIHGDIKPENIMIYNNSVKILDFGLTKLNFLQKNDTDETFNKISDTTYKIIGTPHYMSPEQAIGRAVDFRTDVWSLGVVLYEMLTGKIPFTRKNFFEFLDGVVLVELESNDDIPKKLQKIINRALNKSINNRYQSIKEFRLDLINLRYEFEKDLAKSRQNEIVKDCKKDIDKHKRLSPLRFLKRNIIKDNQTEKMFAELAERWYRETLHSSAYVETILHPAYQRIIGLGKDVLPFILRELQAEPLEWFWALRALTGEDPTTVAMSGKRDEMAQAWLDWGKEKGFI